LWWGCVAYKINASGKTHQSDFSEEVNETDTPNLMASEILPVGKNACSAIFDSTGLLLAIFDAN
jgi:hypothetical protein